MKDNVLHKNSVLALVMITSFITPFIGATVNLALPVISKDFGLNATGMSWVAMAFLLSSAVFLVPFGKLADIAGRKRIFMWGNIILAISSLLCAISRSGDFLIFSRVIQGVGSAMVFATGIALVTSVFPPAERGKAIGLNVTAVYIGLSTSPVIGGLLISAYGWQSLFLVPAILGLLIAFSTHLAMKQEWAEARNEIFDYKGSITYIISMSLFMYGFSKLSQLWAVFITLSGFLGLLFFIRFELKTPFPVMNIQLFRGNRLFAFSNLAALINYAITFAITFILSLYLQYIKGMTPRDAGFFLVVQPVVMALTASFSGRLSDKYDARYLASGGMALIAIGLCMLIPLGASTSNDYIIAVLVILGFGFGMFSSPNTNSIMGSVEKKFLGLASGTVATMRLTGQMLSMGIAALILHVFIGKSSINPENFSQFILACKTVFIVFTVLSVAGIWASLARGKTNNII